MVNHDKAYVIGLLVGGGTITKQTFIIKLPFRKWGADIMNMNRIATDILTRLCQKFEANFGFPVTYKIGKNDWSIVPVKKVSIGRLKDDLNCLGLPNEGFLLDTADLTIVKEKLSGVAVESFLSGIFDARASLTESHRRFTDDAPIVSFEVPGSTRNFRFVVQFCSWLTEMGTVTDQILFNHPNQHSKSDPYYKGWKKGFKIRFLVKSFLARHSFILQAKAIDIERIEQHQSKEEQLRCTERKVRKPSPVCLHSEIDSESLPTEVRNKLFLHYFHFCVQYGCPYAPISEIKKIVNHYKDYIFVLPRLIKGTIHEMESQYNELHQEHFHDKKLGGLERTVGQVLNIQEYQNYHELEQSLAFLFSPELNGKRHSGGMSIILEGVKNEKVHIISPKNTRGYPLLLINVNNDRAAIISSIQGSLNQELVEDKIEVYKTDIKVK